MKNRDSQHVLILNWRDPWHPQSGGAEVVTHRIAAYLVGLGHRVEWFSGAYDGAAGEQTVDGIRFVREGSQRTVHWRAFQRYRGSSAFDVVIDQINTIPFYAHRYMRGRVYAFFHQLAREVWLYEAPWLVGLAGFAAEPLYLMPYRHRPCLVVSESTQQSLRDVGFVGPIAVVPEAVDEPPQMKNWSQCTNDVLCLGRVVRSKRIELAIDAVATLKHKHPWEGQLLVAGTVGPSYRAALEDRAAARGANISFLGRISAAERSVLLARSGIVLMTSIREGWGLVITEAARHGTPAVVVDRPGMRDAVKDGVTGRVVDERPDALAEAIWEVFRDYAAFSVRAYEDSIRFSWERTGEEFARVVDLL